jgi:hypothetical protein
MAIDLTLNNISSGYNLSKFNENFSAIETAFQDALSRSGTTPNSMNADIDLNGYNILNVGTLSITGGITLADIVSYAEEWANKAEDSLVTTAAGGDGVDDYSALHWAAKAAADAILTAADVISTNADAVSTSTDAANAAASALAAAASASEGLYRDVVTVDFTASPYTITSAQDGDIFRVDTSGGTVVINLPDLSLEPNDFRIAVIKETIDANPVTLQRQGTDTINGNTSLNITVQYETINFIGDQDVGIYLATDATISNALLVSNNLSDLDNDATARINLGVEIGTDVLSPTGDGSGLTGIEIPGKNRIINGVAPYVNQRGAQTGVTTSAFCLDRWEYGSNSTATVNLDDVTFSGEDWVEVDVTVADVAVAASDNTSVRQKIESNNIADFKSGTASAETVTLSFKHAHTKTGTHCIAFRNDAGDRAYVAEYTQSVTNTEETATITLTLDTTGTWATGINNGLQVTFPLAVGTNFHTTADAWQAGNFLSTVNQVNNLDSASNFFRIRDMQLELGSVATTPEYEDYETKLAKCQRYYEKSYNQNDAPGTATSNGAATIVIETATQGQGFMFKTHKRTTPTVTTYSVVTGDSGKMRHIGTEETITTGGVGEAGVNIITGTTLTVGRLGLFHYTAESEL